MECGGGSKGKGWDADSSLVVTADEETVGPLRRLWRSAAKPNHQLGYSMFCSVGSEALKRSVKSAGLNLQHQRPRDLPVPQVKEMDNITCVFACQQTT